MPITNREDLLQAINGYQLARCIQAAAELGIADLLADGALTAAALAQRVQVDPDALFRLLRALASAGVFAHLDDGSFALNEPARYLCRDHERSLRALAVLAGQQHYPTWQHLPYSVRHGKVAFNDLHGMNVWQYRAQNAAAGRAFDAAMGTQVGAGAQAIVDACDFSRFSRVVDVGGGQGALLAAILRAHPAVLGVLFEQAHILPGARDYLAQAGVLDRCELVAGDFLQAVTAAGDGVILQRIIHDWDDRQARRILSVCRRAMQAGQTLLLIERLLPASDPPLEMALTDLTMLVMNGGRERTEAELRALLQASGFAVASVVSTGTPLQIIAAQARQDGTG
jgi:hypothetical protein